MHYLYCNHVTCVPAWNLVSIAKGLTDSQVDILLYTAGPLLSSSYRSQNF